VVLRSVGVLSCGKVSGLLYALLGLLAGAVVALISLFGAALVPESERSSGMFGALFGVGAIIFLPIVYGVIGFFSGVIGGALYNLIARFAGGIELDLG